MIRHLYDAIAERWLLSPSSCIFLYSDPHFGDLESYEKRFPDIIKNRELFKKTLGQSESEFNKNVVAQCDQMQIDNINKRCGKRDTLIILGDVGNIGCVRKLRAGYKILIMGNHDQSYEKSSQCYYVYDQNGKLIDTKKFFDEVYEGKYQISPKIILSHEPVHDEYCFNIHGHCHSEIGMFNDDMHLNICAEWTDYQPMSLEGIIKNGYLKNVPNMHRVTIDRATERKAGREYEKRSRKV